MKMTQAQAEKMAVMAERWEYPELLDEIEIAPDKDFAVGYYIGFWTGKEYGKGMHIGIETDGYAHS
jgi:hypothetical protein